jgi:hypothetical protein
MLNGPSVLHTVVVAGVPAFGSATSSTVTVELAFGQGAVPVSV